MINIICAGSQRPGPAFQREIYVGKRQEQLPKDSLCSINDILWRFLQRLVRFYNKFDRMSSTIQHHQPLCLRHEVVAIIIKSAGRLTFRTLFSLSLSLSLSLFSLPVSFFITLSCLFGPRPRQGTKSCRMRNSVLSVLRLVNPPKHANFHAVSQKKCVFGWKKSFPKVAGL